MKLHKIPYFASFLFLVILPFFIVVNVKTAKCSYNGNDYFVIAADLLDRGMYLEALGIYKEIVTYSENRSNQAQALLYIGKTYSKYLDQYDAALQQFENTIKLFPESPSAQAALFNAGVVFYKKGEFKRAYDIFTYYTRIYPQGFHRQAAGRWVENLKSKMDSKKTKTIPPQKRRITDTIMRVLIKNGAPKIILSSDKTITVLHSLSGKMVYRGSGPTMFTKNGTYLGLNGRRLDAERCHVWTEGTTIILDGRRYRGTFSIAVAPGGIEAVNHVPIEEYLYGVVPEEMSHKWKPEALMAQAVAARTYALYVKEKSKDKPYDVEATTFSQVYGGYDAETTASNLAVNATRGQVITYDGKLIISYFHANSGGYTEDARNVWNVDVPYLKGIYDRFSENIPGDTWEYYLSYDVIRNRLNKEGLNIRWIRALQPAGSSRSGRCLQMRVVSDKGTFVFTSNNFRIKVGGTKLKSTRFQTRVYGRGVFFRGNGYGHGVGMSQWGANRMAEAGFNYKAILEHYYRGTRLIAFSSL
jgi:stage II sporulation protein D